MGTNYYLKRNGKHIGKKSSGWAFLFKDRPRYMSMVDVWMYLRDEKIIDEYGEELSRDEFWQMVFAGQSEQHVNPAMVPALFLNDYRQMAGFDFCKGDFS